MLKILATSNLFLTGGAGVGKSFLVREIMDFYASKSKCVVALGSTGISAVAIGGITLHSFFKLGICANFEELKLYDAKISSKIKELNEILKHTDLIVIDEISMVSSNLMELIFYRIQNSKFSGKIIVVGDFYQLAPIKKETNSLFDFTFAFASSTWKMLNFVNVELTLPKRTNDKNFYDVLSNLRIGNVNEKEISYLSAFLNKQSSTDAIALFGTNEQARKLNEKKINELQTKLEISKGYFEIYDENLNVEKIAKWIKNLNIDDELHLKIGAKIIFTTNKWSEFYNGQSAKICDIVSENGEIEFVTVEFEDGCLAKILRQKYDFEEIIFEDEKPKKLIKASYYQFPFKLAYAITIHKSQGMSIENLCCDINQIFAKGQLYVALSRATNTQNLSIIYDKSENFGAFLQKNTAVNKDVKNFYENGKFLRIEEK